MTLARLLDVVREDATAVGVDAEATFERGYRALVTGAAFADAAGDANRLERICFGDIHAIRIDQSVRVAHLAPQRNGIAADRGAVGSPGF